MFKQPLLLATLLCITLSTVAQSITSLKYKDFVFATVTKTQDLSYGVLDSSKKDKSRLFDLYQPAGDSSTERPMIIWMHGGGFKFGSKNAAGIELWSETFAKRGYVCAAINYSLSKHNPLFNFDELLKSTYYAVQDARAAVEYFRKNCKLYNINPDKIILAGNSSGGMIALQAAYSNNYELAKLAGLPATTDAAKLTTLPKVAAVINYWGGMFDLNWLKNGHVPIVSVHGSNDRIIPLTHKDAPLYGSLAIHEKADELKIRNDLKVFEGYAHELHKHFNPILPASNKIKERWLQAGQYTADFLYANIIK